MQYLDLPVADPAAIDDEVTDGGWVMLVICASKADHEMLDELLPDGNDEIWDNYNWYRVNAAGESGQRLVIGYDLEPDTQFAILSLYRGRPETFVLDDLDERDADDVLQFMDDHAAAIEFEDEDEDWED